MIPKGRDGGVDSLPTKALKKPGKLRRSGLTEMRQYLLSNNDASADVREVGRTGGEPRSEHMSTKCFSSITLQKRLGSDILERSSLCQQLLIAC